MITMRRPLTRQTGLAAAAVLTLSLGVLAGCGGGDDDSTDEPSSTGTDTSASASPSEEASADTSDFTSQSADKILDDGIAALKSADSLRLQGDLQTNGQKLALDIALDKDGNCAGTIGAGNGTAQVINTGGKAYLKADREFYAVATGDDNVAGQITTVVGDRWVTGVPDDSFSGICDLDDFLDELDPSGSTLSKGDTSDLDGQEVIEILDEDSDDGASSIFIATADPHYALKAEKTDGDEPGSITFSDFDEPVDATAPPADETIDFSKLSGAAGG